MPSPKVFLGRDDEIITLQDTEVTDEYASWHSDYSHLILEKYDEEGMFDIAYVYELSKDYKKVILRNEDVSIPLLRQTAIAYGATDPEFNKDGVRR